VDAFARNHKIPAEWAEKGVRKEDYVRPYAQRMERRNRFGVYFILGSEQEFDEVPNWRGFQEFLFSAAIRGFHIRCAV